MLNRWSSDMAKRVLKPQAACRSDPRCARTGSLKARAGPREMSISIDHIDTAYAGWGQYLIATVRLADGTLVRREIEHHGAAACVLPYDPARKTAILVRQFRAPVFYIAGAAETLEAIAGIIETESPVECARREALEEAGVRLQTLEPVGAVFTM